MHFCVARHGAGRAWLVGCDESCCDMAREVVTKTRHQESAHRFRCEGSPVGTYIEGESCQTCEADYAGLGNPKEVAAQPTPQLRPIQAVLACAPLLTCRTACVRASCWLSRGTKSAATSFLPRQWREHLR
jgi:hypothetical protein